MTTTALKPSQLNEIAARIERREAVKLQLPDGGRLSLERGLPYLFVHRASEEGRDEGTVRLLGGEAAVLAATTGAKGVDALVRRVAEAGSNTYGAFLVLELWAGPPGSTTFAVRGPAGPAPETVEALTRELEEVAQLYPGLDVAFQESDERGPPGATPILSIRESWERGILYLGLEIPPIYRDGPDGPVYPRFLRRLQRALSRALRQTAYEFIRVQTTFELENYHALGTQTVADFVREADRALAAIERSFSLLILTSPVNIAEAWDRFRADQYQRDPVFHYRLLPMDPDLLKRQLYNVPLELIEDPALAYLMQDKREELDRQLSMLGERGSPDFRFGSMRLYGAVDDELLEVATELLRTIPPPRGRPATRERWVDSREFLRAAEAEFAHYAQRHPAILDRKIEIRPDLVGLMVSEGNLLIGSHLRIAPSRVGALLHHEVGTHVLTFVNGAAQPFEQLSLGLAGYDELQEGLAVLAEYLVGALDRSRMRLLAARVLAAHAVEQGATFVETFALLTGGYGFTPRGAWHIVARVFTCGGFTRDLIYLRGLISLLAYLRSGGDLHPLYIGKIAQRHIPVVEELRHRRILRAPPLVPRFLNDPAALRRLEAVRAGIPLIALVTEDQP